jgi:hypothetical protein
MALTACLYWSLTTSTKGDGRFCSSKDMNLLIFSAESGFCVFKKPRQALR